ncbi:hypothetical protein VNO78_30770 [Psophocarpus tetragonolobus]|uniref:HTH myb-type domain-containing protein n=1 Tax=Psophocarpus tetragonolobus TaxID=3891 RepID=A0AAN9X5M0_PSOTE
MMAVGIKIFNIHYHFAFFYDRLFLHGLKLFGKGHWQRIAQLAVLTKTPAQIASHAQKYFLNQSNVKEKKRSSIHDITLESELVSHVDQHNPEHRIQLFHEVHQAREMIGLQNDKLVLPSRDQQNSIQQISQKLKSEELTGFEGSNLVLHHIDKLVLHSRDQQNSIQQISQKLKSQELTGFEGSNLVLHHIDKLVLHSRDQQKSQKLKSQELTGFEGSNLVLHHIDKSVLHSRDQQNPIQQISQKLKSEELTGFEGSNLVLHHIDQQCLLPPNMQQFPPHIDHHYLNPFPELIDLSPHPVDLSILHYLQSQQWDPPSHLQNQQFPYFGHYSWVSN